MLFRDEKSEDDAYDYVHPEGVLSLVGGPVPIPTVNTSDRAKQRAAKIAHQKTLDVHFVWTNYNSVSTNQLVLF